MAIKGEKHFDAVQMMRELREGISRDIEGMTLEQETAYIRERLRQAREGEATVKREHAA